MSNSLTKLQILQAEPGRLLDSWVAHALGWPVIGPHEPYRRYHGKVDGIISEGWPERFNVGLIPRRWSPSSCLKDAQWLLSHTTKTTKENWELGIFSNGYQATFYFEGGRNKPWLPGEYRVDSIHSVEHAITQAFLLSFLEPES